MVDVGVNVAVGVSVAVAVAVGVSVKVAVGVGVGVSVGSGVDVAVGEGVEVSVGGWVEEPVGEGDGEAVPVPVGMGAGVGTPGPFLMIAGRKIEIPPLPILSCLVPNAAADPAKSRLADRVNAARRNFRLSSGIPLGAKTSPWWSKNDWRLSISDCSLLLLINGAGAHYRPPAMKLSPDYPLQY